MKTIDEYVQNNEREREDARLCVCVCARVCVCVCARARFRTGGERKGCTRACQMKRESFVCVCGCVRACRCQEDSFIIASPPS